MRVGIEKSRNVMTVRLANAIGMDAVVDEAKKVGVMVQVHAVSSKAMVAAVEAGVPLLVHLPNKDWVSKEDAKRVAAAGVKVLGTVGFGSPVFGVFADDNKARFRDGKAWPEGIAPVSGSTIPAMANPEAISPTVPSGAGSKRASRCSSNSAPVPRW